MEDAADLRSTHALRCVIEPGWLRGKGDLFSLGTHGRLLARGE